MWYDAEEWAARLTAYDEAIAHLERGLALLEGAPASPEGLLLESLSVGGLPPSVEVEARLHHALEIAHRQEARWLELRTAVSLARFWRSEGRRNEARELLTGICGWFAEGSDTGDLVEARALLDELE